MQNILSNHLTFSLSTISSNIISYVQFLAYWDLYGSRGAKVVAKDVKEGGSSKEERKKKREDCKGRVDLAKNGENEEE